MTETRDSRVDYKAISDRAFELARLIHDEMAKLDHMTDERWEELHDLTKTASAAYCTATRFYGRQLREHAAADLAAKMHAAEVHDPAADEVPMTLDDACPSCNAPVPYLPASLGLWSRRHVPGLAANDFAAWSE